jgi:DNA-binding LacI/PurR family transcriptional regulator
MSPTSAANPGSAPGARGPRIGFMAAYMNNAYEWDIWRGVRKAVEERGGTVVCFAGAGIGDVDPEHQARSGFFELIHASNVDAILCLTSVLGQHAGVHGTEAWVLGRGLPACSIGPAAQLPSVTVDDTAGVTQLMAHLIEHHEHQRIAFITGSRKNHEAARRLEAYERALKNHNLEVDPRLILDGDFTTESGGQAIRELFDRRQVPVGELHAVVASNDYMAFGAVDELVRRRISVPDQVAVVGFDDITPARVHSPALTTVRQPLEELGRQGANRLLDLLDGKPTEGPSTLETELVLRRSCGCVPTSRFALPDETFDSGKPALELKTREVLERALLAELEGEPGTFAAALEPLIRQAVANGTTDFDLGRRFADEFCTRMRLVSEDVVYERLTKLARVLHTKMFGPPAHLSLALAEHLPAFEIDECAVSALVLESTAGHVPKSLKLAFGFDATTLQPQMETFDATLLAPPSFSGLRRRSVFVMPLTCGAEALGIAVVPAGAQAGGFYETLAQLFATVLKVLEVRAHSPAARARS